MKRIRRLASVEFARPVYANSGGKPIGFTRGVRTGGMRLDAMATDGVERAETSGPPTAFRIWKAGMNVTDHGPTVFSERSAAKLVAEQSTRGNRYSIDVDHMSLDKEAPLENHKAVGFHSLAVRNGELWAVDVEWTDAVRAGLSKDPPEWKYFSPAYDVDPDTGEVVSYLNTALTNNPATHRVTALASRGAKVVKMADAKKMTWGAIKAALDGDDEDAKAKAYATIAAAFPDGDGDADGDKKDAADEPEKKDAKASEDEPAKKDAEAEPEKKDAKKCADDEPEKKDSIAATVAAMDARLRAFEAKTEADDRASTIASRVMSADLAKTLADQPLSTVRKICSALPLKQNISKSTETVTATRGGNDQNSRASRLSPDEKRRLDERMGLSVKKDSIRWEGSHRVFPVLAQPVKEAK